MSSADCEFLSIYGKNWNCKNLQNTRNMQKCAIYEKYLNYIRYDIYFAKQFF